jgi:Xaa-Pro aminopeptidase
VPAEYLDRRVGAARERLAASEVDAHLVLHPPNIAWLTGFRGTSAALILTSRWLYFITDFRYSRAVDCLAAAGQLPSNTKVFVAERSYEEAIVSALREPGAARVGIEADHLPVRRFQWFQNVLGTSVELVPLPPLIERLRAIKDAVEQQIYREAAARLAGVAAQLPRWARLGRLEREVAADIDYALKGAGFERPAFETIVASGPNSAYPHSRPTERALTAGDPVVLDFGGVYGGYCVDLTRTAVVRSASDAFARMADAVLEAQQAAIARVRPGVRASAVDAAARDVLAAHGLGEAFGHATGHGLGLEVHEHPRIGRPTMDGEDPLLEAGMVFTIEPGAYVAGLGGVRIEDDVLVGPAGADVLTDIPRGLLMLGA